MGVPREIQSDQGSQYRNQLVSKLTDQLTIHHHFGTAYHPESQGIVERVNGTMMRHPRKLLLDS